jgi:hypothetical protein
VTGRQSLLISGGPFRRIADDRWKSAPINPLICRDEEPTLEPADAAAFAPVAGVTIELFARIAMAVAARADSGVQGTELARHCGIPAQDWLNASRAWNRRIAAHPGVAGYFMGLCRPAETPQDLAS